VTVSVIVDGLGNFARYVAQLPEITRKAARLAINDVADDARAKIIPDAIEAQVAFPAGYLDGDDKLAVTQRATDTNLEAQITARQRATSLARFAPGAVLGARGQAGVQVTVTPGQPINLKRAFLVRLRRGASLAQDNFNVGLAVRLAPGQTLRNRRDQSVARLADNVYLLYAPSVDQVFSTVAEDISESLATLIGDEFSRQFVRLSDE
jgi:L-asparaginase II